MITIYKGDYYLFHLILPNLLKHKDGIPLTDPNNPKIYKLQYGLEELYNRHHVDLVLSGHEHAFEMFPPIQLNKEVNKVVPHKYWWDATRYVNEGNTTDQHDFMAFRVFILS